VASRAPPHLELHDSPSSQWRRQFACARDRKVRTTDVIFTTPDTPISEVSLG